MQEIVVAFIDIHKRGEVEENTQQRATGWDSRTEAPVHIKAAQPGDVAHWPEKPYLYLYSLQSNKMATQDPNTQFCSLFLFCNFACQHLPLAFLHLSLVVLLGNIVPICFKSRHVVCLLSVSVYTRSCIIGMLLSFLQIQAHWHRLSNISHYFHICLWVCELINYSTIKIQPFEYSFFFSVTMHFSHVCQWWSTVV